MSLDIDKSRVSDPSLEFMPRLGIVARFRAPRAGELVKLLQHLLFRDRIIRAIHVSIPILELDPPTGLNVCIGLVD